MKTVIKKLVFALIYDCGVTTMSLDGENFRNKKTVFLLEKTAHDLASPVRHIQSLLLFLREAWESGDQKEMEELIQLLSHSADRLKIVVDEVIVELFQSI